MDFIYEDNLKAVSWGIDDVVNGLTEKGRLYQFSLEYNTFGFQLAWQEYEGNTALYAVKRMDFSCQSFDSVDLKLAITNGVVELTARDLDSKTNTPVTIKLPAVGDEFIGKGEGHSTGTSIFMEIQSGTLKPPVPREEYTIVQPAGMTKVKFFMEAFAVESPEDWKSSSLTALARADSGWVDVDSLDKNAVSLDSNGILVQSMGAYGFSIRSDGSSERLASKAEASLATGLIRLY